MYFILFMATIVAFSNVSKAANNVCVTSAIEDCVEYQAQDMCVLCIDGKYPTDGGTRCDVCEVATNVDCTSCDVVNDVTVCTACVGSLVVDASGMQCVSCSDAIVDCDTCVVGASPTTCDVCIVDKVPSEDGQTCVACPDASCSKCSEDNQCSVCLDSDKVPSGGETCEECSALITDCANCAVDAGVVKCDACADIAKVPSEDGSACVECSALITDCVSCAVDAGVVKCDACAVVGKGPSEDGAECVTCTHPTCSKCSHDEICSVCVDASLSPTGGPECTDCVNIIADCDRCVTSDGNTICAECVSPDKFPTPDGMLCESCDSIIPGCNACAVNEAGQTICTACNDVNFPTIDGKACESCDNVYSGCVTCGYDYSAQRTICHVCDETDHFPSTSGCCSLCAGVIGGCFECVLDDITSCSRCYNNLDLSQDGTACVAAGGSDDDSDVGSDEGEITTSADGNTTEDRADERSTSSLTLAGCLTTGVAALLGLSIVQ